MTRRLRRLAIAPLATVLCVAVLPAAPAQAEVTEESDTHFVTRHALDVKAAPKDVWLALISPGDWWNDAHTWSADASNMTLTPQAGGCFCETIPAEDGASTFGLEGSVQHMTVVQSLPRKVLRMRGALGPLQSEPVDGVLTITLQEIEDDDGEAAGTRIVWEYVGGGTMRFEVPQIAKAVDGVIGQQALGLAEAMGGVIPPEDESKSAFDGAFGEGLGAESEDGAKRGETPATGLGKGR